MYTVQAVSGIRTHSQQDGDIRHPMRLSRASVSHLCAIEKSRSDWEAAPFVSLPFDKEAANEGKLSLDR